AAERRVDRPPGAPRRVPGELQGPRGRLAVLAEVERPELGEGLDAFAHAESLRRSSATASRHAGTSEGQGAWTVRIWRMNDQKRQAPRITARWNTSCGPIAPT